MPTAQMKDFIQPGPVHIDNCVTINIHKQDDASPANALQAAVFTLFADNAPQGGSRGPEDTATAKTCTTDAAGNCSMADITPGQYWVVETTTPAGYATAPDQHLTASLGMAPVNLTFTDKRLYAVIVLVCQESNKQLYPSTITIDGVTKTSMGPGSGSALGLTDQALCSLGNPEGAAYHGKPAGSYAGRVTIP